jgi:predicted RNA-binding protein YlqC (UPF0109 family)
MSDDNAGNVVEADDIDDNVGNVIQGALAKAAVEYIVKNIVDEPDAVTVEVEESGNTVTLRVHVAEDDKGKVIGKRGRVAQAVRTVVRAIGSREGVTVMVDIAD